MTIEERIGSLMQSTEFHDRQLGEITEKPGSQCTDRPHRSGTRISYAGACLVRAQSEERLRNLPYTHLLVEQFNTADPTVEFTTPQV